MVFSNYLCGFAWALYFATENFNFRNSVKSLLLAVVEGFFKRNRFSNENITSSVLCVALLYPFWSQADTLAAVTSWLRKQSSSLHAIALDGESPEKLTDILHYFQVVRFWLFSSSL